MIMQNEDNCSLQAWPALSSQRGVESNPGPVSNLLMPEFWCSIGYFELDTQVLMFTDRDHIMSSAWFYMLDSLISFNSGHL